MGLLLELLVGLRFIAIIFGSLVAFAAMFFSWISFSQAVKVFLFPWEFRRDITEHHLRIHGAITALIMLNVYFIPLHSAGIFALEFMIGTSMLALFFSKWGLVMQNQQEQRRMNRVSKTSMPPLVDPLLLAEAREIADHNGGSSVASYGHLLVANYEPEAVHSAQMGIPHPLFGFPGSQEAHVK